MRPGTSCPTRLSITPGRRAFVPAHSTVALGCYISDAQGIKLYCSPKGYASDNLTNNELGWKTEFFAHRLQWNGAVYQENWNNVQIDVFDPGVLGNAGFSTNGPNYRIRGLETSIVALITEGLTAQGGASWNTSRQINSPYLIANNPQLLNNRGEQGRVRSAHLASQNVYGPIGGPSANSPPIQFNVRLRYEWTMNSYNSFVQVGATHTGHSFTQSSANPELSAGSHVSTTLLQVRESCYLRVRRLCGRRQGCVDGGALRAKSHRRHQEHVHLHRSIRGRGHDHAAEGHRSEARIQVLIRQRPGGASR